MKEYEKGVWYCSFRLNCGYLFISPFVRLQDADPIIPEFETLPDNWEDILEKISSEHYASTDDGTRHRYVENWFISHTPMRASWPKAARGMAIIRNGEAVVHIPPELKSPTKKKHLREVLCLIPKYGVSKTIFIVEPTYAGEKAQPQEQILVDTTSNGEKICICEGCRCTKTPHFFWYPKHGKPVCLMLEKAILMDLNANMELRERQRLQEYLTYEHWYKLLNMWNDHNKMKVSPMQHIPYYIDLHTKKRNQCLGVIKKNGKSTARILLYSEDEDERPHFHYQRPNGTEQMISLTSATYLEPITEELTKAEKAALIQYLSTPLPFAHTKKPAYERLCDYWDHLHKSSFFKTGLEGDIFPMPDYMKLKRIESYNNPKE